MAGSQLNSGRSCRERVSLFGRVLRLYWSLITALLLFLFILVITHLFLNQTTGRLMFITMDEESIDFWRSRQLPLPLKQGRTLNHLLTSSQPSSNHLTPTHTKLTKVGIHKPHNTTSSRNPLDHRTPPFTGPWVLAITPTYTRPTQKVDLTSLCQTLMNVPDLIWIVVEDSDHRTDLVTRLLTRCQVWTVHLNTSTSGMFLHAKGVEQRNHGLSWLRKFCFSVRSCSGGVYFMDDDNKYDLRVFQEVRTTRHVGVWPVGFIGGAPMEGPRCDSRGRITKWVSLNQDGRTFPVDMAGFALNIKLLLTKSQVVFGRDSTGEVLQVRGVLETAFLENFVGNLTDPRLECRGPSDEVLVWHVKTREPVISQTISNYGFEI